MTQLSFKNLHVNLIDDTDVSRADIILRKEQRTRLVGCDILSGYAHIMVEPGHIETYGAIYLSGKDWENITLPAYDNLVYILSAEEVAGRNICIQAEQGGIQLVLFKGPSIYRDELECEIIALRNNYNYNSVIRQLEFNKILNIVAKNNALEYKPLDFSHKETIRNVLRNHWSRLDRLQNIKDTSISNELLGIFNKVEMTIPQGQTIRGLYSYCHAFMGKEIGLPTDEALIKAALRRDLTNYTYEILNEPDRLNEIKEKIVKEYFTLYYSNTLDLKLTQKHQLYNEDIETLNNKRTLLGLDKLYFMESECKLDYGITVNKEAVSQFESTLYNELTNLKAIRAFSDDALSDGQLRNFAANKVLNNSNILWILPAKHKNTYIKSIYQKFLITESMGLMIRELNAYELIHKDNPIYLFTLYELIKHNDAQLSTEVKIYVCMELLELIDYCNEGSEIVIFACNVAKLLGIEQQLPYTKEGIRQAIQSEMMNLRKALRH